MIDPDRLRVLVAFARTGSVTAAAESLHLTQPTVSHHLRRLEAETGGVLLRAVGRGLVLTDAGRRLAERGEEILGLVARAETEMAAFASLERGTVRLALFPSAVATIAPRILERASRRHPGLEVELVEAEPPEAERLLLADGVDLALSFVYPNETGGELITAEELGEDRLFLVRPPVPGDGPMIDAALDVADLRALADEPWLAGCERCRASLVATCAAAGFEPRIAFASDDSVAVQALVAVGHGVSILPELALRAHRDPGVTVVPIRGSSRSLRLLSLGRPPLPPAISAVGVLVREVVGELAER